MSDRTDEHATSALVALKNAAIDVEHLCEIIATKDARIEELESLNSELLAALDHLGSAVRLADTGTAMTVGFVWEQNKDHILAGRTTWADQKVAPPLLGGTV